MTRSDLFAASLDACLHAALALTMEGLLVPVSAECVEIERKPEGDLRSLVQRRGEQFDIEVRDSQGVCARIEGLREFTVLSTCNRVEFYGVASRPDVARGE